MSIKKVILFTFVLFLSVSLLVSAVPKKPVKKGQPVTSDTFMKGDRFATFHLGLYSGHMPFGGSYEYAITENVGVGVNVTVWFWSDFGYSYGVIAPAAEAAYHFTKLGVEKLDVAAGGGIGYAIGTGDAGSALYLYPFLNGRYFITEKIAINLRLDFAIGDYNGVGSTIGVTFKLNK